jgi:hypothetical protein
MAGLFIFMDVVVIERELPWSSHYGFDGWTYCRRILLMEAPLTEVEFQEADGEGNA